MDDDRAAALAEAYKRNILPPDMKAAYDEATKRGLVAKSANDPDSKKEPSAYQKSMAEQRASHPRGDLLGDMGSAAKSAVAGIPEGFRQMFPSPQEMKAKQESDRDKYGMIGGALKTEGGRLMDVGAGAAKIPLSVFRTLLSPLTGALHASAGSALSYLPGMETPEVTPEKKARMEGNPVAKGLHALGLGGLLPDLTPRSAKENADAMVDQLMMAIPAGSLERGAIAAGEGARFDWDYASATRQQAKDALKSDAREGAAVNAITKRMKEDAKAGGMTAVDAINAMNASKKPLTLADLGGENVKALAGKIAREPGESRAIIKNFLDSRDLDAGTRLEADIDQHLTGGATGTAAKTFKTLGKAKSEQAAIDYKEFYDANQHMDSPELRRIAESPAGRKAFSKAVEKMQNSRKNVGKVDPELTALVKELVETGKMPDPSTGKGIARGLKAETWDYVKRSIDDQHTAAKRAGEKDDARILDDLRKDLITEMEKLDVTAKAGPNSTKVDGGSYARARRNFSGVSKSQEALEAGKDFFKPSVSPEQIAEEFSAMTSGEKEFYKLGVADEAKARIAQAGVGGDETKAIAKNPWMIRKLRAITDGPQQAADFLQAITDERTMFDTKYDVTGNSRSAARIKEDGNADIEHLKRGVGVGEKLLSGRPLSAMWDAWSLSRDLKKLTDPEVNASIARMLTDTQLSLTSGAGQSLQSSFARSQALSQSLLQRINSIRNQAGAATMQRGVPSVMGNNALRTMLPSPSPQPPQGQ